MVKVCLGLGSNLGKRERNIAAAIEDIKKLANTTVKKISRNYETEPVGKIDQPKFINAAMRIETGLSPQELLRELHKIEAKLGRVRNENWGPRTIDLDILTYGKEVIDTADLKIPHPLMTERRFVLEPLAEIVPELKHPVLQQTYRELLAKIRV